MTQFHWCRCITVDGHDFLEGFLGLDWLPSERAKRSAAEYEKQVIAQLNEIFRNNWTGWAVMCALTDTGKSVKIVPSHIPDFASATPADWDVWQQKIPTSDLIKAKYVTVTYSPISCAEYPGCHTGQVAARRPDEVLLHELVHALRLLQVRQEGRMFSGVGRWSYGNQEEFLAILVTNIYISEKKRGPLRGQWIYVPGERDVLSGEAATSEGFLKDAWRLGQVADLEMQERLLFNNIRNADAFFNPIREHLDHHKKPPMVPD
jgi:hypothetical protein